MSGMDDFIKGASMFTAGVQRLAMNNALNSASKKINEINQTVQDENERLMASSQVANDLAMQLAATGADAATIDQTAGRMGISGAAQFNAGQQRDLQANTQAFNAGENAKDRSLKRELAGMQAQQDRRDLSNRLDREQGKLLTDLGSKFESAAKKNLEAVGQARVAKDLLATGNPIADAAIPTFMARATGEVGNLTEEERRPFGSSRAVKERLKDAVVQWKSGNLSGTNRKLISLLAGKMEESNMQRVREVRSRFARRGQKLLGLKDRDMPLEEIESIIFDEASWDPSGDEQAAPSPQGAAPSPQSKADRYQSYWGK